MGASCFQGQEANDTSGGPTNDSDQITLWITTDTSSFKFDARQNWNIQAMKERISKIHNLNNFDLMLENEVLKEQLTCKELGLRDNQVIQLTLK